MSALEASRYCPRDDKVTRWSNETTNGSLILECEECGLNASSALTDEEQARVTREDAKPVKMRRRAYVVV
jgi:hypothetical protein